MAMTKPTPVEVAERLIILKYQTVHSMAIPPHHILQEARSNWSGSERKKYTKALKEKSDELVASMKHLQLWKHMTKEEREFISASAFKVKPQHHLNAMWRLESVVVLMWAMEMIEDFPPFDSQSEGDLLQMIPYENVPEFIVGTKLRAEEVIEEMRSLAELWHWRSRTRELIEMGEVPPSELDFSSYDEIVRRTANLAFEHRDLPNMVNEDFPVKGKAYRDLSDREWSVVRSITLERHYSLNWLCGYASDNRWDKTPTDT
jgi:hypothetical protein